MTTPTMPDEIIAKIRESEFVMGKCNCQRCSQRRMDEAFDAAVKDIYPALPFLPRIFNHSLRYMDRPVEWRNFNGAKRWTLIIETLHKLRKDNKKRRERLIRKGITSRTFCADCGQLFAKELAVTTKVWMQIGRDPEDRQLCPDCIQKYYFQCEECKGWHPTGRKFTIITDLKYHRAREAGSRVPASAWVTVCMRCHDTVFMRCTHCGLYLREKDWVDITEASGRPPRHARVTPRTQDPEDFLLPEEDGPTGNEEWLELPSSVLCQDCYSTNAMHCARCGDLIFRFNAQMGRNGEALCAQCVDDDRLIHAHNYRPKKFRFKASKLQRDVHTPEVLHYGIELEVEDMGIWNKSKNKYIHLMDREEMAQRALDFIGKEDAYVVHDGSLNRSPMGGIEIVSHPMTWEYYRENADRWTELLMKLREWGGQAYRPGTAGLHYHMTKSAFTTFQLYKFVGFFYKKSAENFVTAIAQRHGHERYARWNNADRDHVKVTAKKKYNASSDRYSAINLTNKTTVEARIFRGTLEPLWFHKNMEFLQALFEYSRDNTPMDMTATKFAEYVLRNRKRFICLHEFIKYDRMIAINYPSITNLFKKGVK